MISNILGSMRNWLAAHEKISVALLLVVFVLLRLPGTDSPLHQDEYKWPIIVNPANGEGFVPHPPLTQFIFRTAGHVVGFDTDFRFIPLFFGAINLVLLYCLMKMWFGRREALVASLIWIFSYFSILASLMVDTDGQILPFFFLLALICYHKWKNTSGGISLAWGGLLAACCLLGLLVKLSFALAILAIIADFLWSKRFVLGQKDIMRIALKSVLGVAVFIALLFIIQNIFPFFDLSRSFEYWKHFWTADRNWFQTFIQCAKALLYASPFLVLVPFLATREIISKTKVFVFFLAGALFFYVILFDFSIGALDRYLQLVVLPLTILCAAIIVSVFESSSIHESRRTREFVLLGTAVGLLLLLLQFLPHYVPPLHPKAEWIGRIFSLRWNFLYPFFGGSGPLGFYISFLFMAVSWIISILVFVFAFERFHMRRAMLIILLAIGISYNAVFAGEYLFGAFNGSAPKLLAHAVEYIENNPDIHMVTVYNDNGGNEIKATGKYRKRLYVDPMFDPKDKIIALNEYKEHYFVLNIPRLDPHSVYQKYFDSCTIIYTEKDKSISAIIYDCRNAPDIVWTE